MKMLSLSHTQYSARSECRCTLCLTLPYPACLVALDESEDQRSDVCESSSVRVWFPQPSPTLTLSCSRVLSEQKSKGSLSSSITKQLSDHMLSKRRSGALRVGLRKSASVLSGTQDLSSSSPTGRSLSSRMRTPSIRFKELGAVVRAFHCLRLC